MLKWVRKVILGELKKMIPIRLKVRNFMCYRDNVPPLSFDGIHTACICGDNGNGKSALIDAMTWALWGRTRAKSDDDLIHSNQAEMEVEFDFAVGQQVYRIIRKHAKPKRRQAAGQSSLDLLIASGDGFKPLSGERIKQTQQKIIDMLHMDYDTFVNSALLRQGDADQFTKQTPVKRKEVLANILGLTVYDELEEQAKERAREQEAEKAQLESMVKDIDGELAHKPAYEAELGEAQGKLSRLEGMLGEQEGQLNKLRQEKEALEGKRQQLSQLEAHIVQTEKDLERWDEQIRQHRPRLQEYEEVMTRRSSIEEGYAQLAEVRKLNDELDRKFRRFAALNERKHGLDLAIVRAKESLLKAHALAQSRIDNLTEKEKRLAGLRNDLYQAQVEFGRLYQEEESLRRKRHSSQELRAVLSYLKSSTAQLECEIAEIEEKLKLLSPEAGARCPLCETELGAEGLKLVKTKYEADKQSQSDSLKSNQAELARRKTELVLLENEISRLETRLNQDKAAAQGRASVISQQIAEAEQAANQLEEAKKALDDIEEHLAKKDYATTEQKVLDEVERELAALGYDSQQHESVRQRLASLEQYEAPKRRLEEADRLYIQERESLAYAGKASEELRQSLEVDKRRRQELTTELGLLPTLVDNLTRAEAEHEALATQRKQAEGMVWTVKGKLQRCSELEEKRREKERLLAEAAKQEGIYRDLAEAFGKKGVQALLIEMALPEIEVEASRLLARMTDNRMHVKIETQRETKKGDLLETLDITISDEFGTRNYEMFSGGEAFRINFAIRIALSKLLAGRAGAPLRTLIMDEGFGTQDSDGIEKLKEAINSIQDDFDRILVITHIDELKDAFPTRIDVIKTAEGSTLQLN